MIISGDVYLTIKGMKNVGWRALRQSSINRILYVASVVYSFRFPDEKNLFEDNYHFVITLSGPEEATIQAALINLQSNEVIIRGEEGYYINKIDQDNGFENLPLFDIKKNWIEDMAYIIGIYGEDKIYDFIFRDPEYRISSKSNSERLLDIGSSNETVKFLNGFKHAFEEKIGRGEPVLDNRKYLELYFEYVFGNILRGEQ